MSMQGMRPLPRDRRCARPADKLDMEASRIEINRVLKSFSQLESWGRFEEPVLGESEFAREIRKRYRDFRRADVIDSSPVAEEKEEFAYSLQACGC